MAQTFLFYDLETTGFYPKFDRVVQFAAQRTDTELNPVGRPFNYLIRLSSDVLPQPDAVFLTGITPQMTNENGISEADFLKIFTKEISLPETIFIGFNNIRFDDEFMRYLLYRNLYDPYAWQWEGGRSRWDMMDLVRMTRALRPQGISWPVDETGKPSNQLVALASANKLQHAKAHDASSDVMATIELARLIKKAQPRLFNFLFEHRTKDKVAEIVNSDRPFLYTSGKYSHEFERTALVAKLSSHPERGGALVYDLSSDPSQWLELSAEELADAWTFEEGKDEPRLPIKTLLFNRCPAVAPMSVLDAPTIKRLKIELDKVNQYHRLLQQHPDFADKVLKALELLNKKQTKRYNQISVSYSVDARLYDKFFSDKDKGLMKKVHSATPSELNGLDLIFEDDRANQLFNLFMARNYPSLMNAAQVKFWHQHIADYLSSGDEKGRLKNYFSTLDELKKLAPNKKQKTIIDALEAWAKQVD